MKPYTNHFEYIRDIQRLTDLKINVYKNKPDEAQAGSVSECYNGIKERAALTKEFFIPIEYIINVFYLNELEAHFFYTLFLYESDIKYREKLSGIQGLESLTMLSFEAMTDLACCKEKPSRISYAGFTDNLLSFESGGGFKLKPEIISFIFGSGEPNKKPWFEFYHASMGGEGLIFDEDIIFAFSSLTKKYLEDKETASHIISVMGNRGSGRRSLLRHIAYKNDISILFVDCKMITHKNDFEKITDEIKTECLLTQSFLCFCGIEAILSDEEKLSALLWGIKQVSRLVFVTSEEGGFDFYDYKYKTTEFKAPVLNTEGAASLWQRELQDCARDESVDLKAIINLFKLTPLQIKQAVQAACTGTASKGEERIGHSELVSACRYVSTKNISALGKIIEPVFGWEDLVLPPEQKELLRSALDRIEFRDIVYKEWGFEKKMPYGAGVHILLCGPPGTGKTMTAQVFSHMLGLPVYKIDLSAVMSKYIGETEKSLSKVFEEGKNTGSILFFDEADALFGKRTEIKDSHDRHANLQVSFLLQKIEEHQGIVLLATNLVKNFDEAFKRRFHYIINIPMPDALHRRQIWENAFPDKTPLNDDIDFEYLSDRFNLSGSTIKNIALSSAFYAAGTGKPVGMNEIIKALKNEAVKNGSIVQAEDFLDYE